MLELKSGRATIFLKSQKRYVENGNETRGDDLLNHTARNVRKCGGLIFISVKKI